MEFQDLSCLFRSWFEFRQQNRFFRIYCEDGMSFQDMRSLYSSVRRYLNLHSHGPIQIKSLR